MLSDSERRRLEELEAGLRADDPTLARALAGRPSPSGSRRKVAAAWIAAAAVVTAITGLIVGSVATVVVAICALGVAAGVWWQAPGR
ncbi:DUF3040 domain-containing protein [Dactylosporangium aurantiacum]|uniref:DUF3040 domain-containing protein n=1 Tax=Dactylosporangium aurantiacum TaxID=35754 RepID=A0A9Q9IN03_9ACTN|nr:DUF3040 domain-containing protein [Dactylosporangium aurantiacum]MDG6110340.1 DUF3040 domain-containing protein [Dactylosporangium aurantiacum]UWZ58626.1 DUF3040 domain-containing protein [Dactylosporangium aurantiacum]